MRTIAVDFDGVIHKYGQGWHDGTIYDELMPGAVDGIRQLQERYAVYVHTSRHAEPVAAWLNERGLPATTMSAWVDGYPDEAPWEFWTRQDLLLVTAHKIAAVAYLDDRAVRFDSWPVALSTLNVMHLRGEL